jgi:hypothetical protein
MQMVKKSFAILVILWLSIIVLMPKQELYYKLEEELAKYEIKLNEKKLDEGLFSVSLKDVTVYVKGIDVATIKEVKLCTFLFYNRIKLQSLHLDETLKRMMPQVTQKAVIAYSVFSPLDVSIEASGSFGSIDGVADLSERKVRLDFNESKNIEMLKPQLKKDEKGWFYETSF